MSEEKGGRGYWGFVIWPVVVVMIYVLSVGPAVFAVERKVVGEGLLVIYLPLKQLKNTPFERPLKIYISWWLPLYKKRGTPTQ